MRNFVQPGWNLTIPAPADVVSGQMVQVGALFGVATHDALNGEDLTLATEGVFEVGKTAPLTINLGDRLFFDSGNSVVNKTSAAQLAVGYAVQAATSAATTVMMKLRASTPVGT